MAHRFFVKPPVDSERVLLAGPEFHHLRNVLRLKPGDEVTLFDGTGREHAARVVQLGRSDVELNILRTESVDRELPRQAVVGVTLPKGDRQRWLVEKLVELGATRLVPLRTARSIVHPSASALARLRRTVIEASKQCGRNRLLEIDGTTSFQEFLASSPDSAYRWIADRAGAHRPAAAHARESGDTYVLIGPEGGLTDLERQAAAASGWRSIALGDRILRIETAAVVMMTLAGFGLLTASGNAP